MPRGSAAANMLHLGALPLDARRAPWLYRQVVELADRAGVRHPACSCCVLPSPTP